MVQAEIFPCYGNQEVQVQMAVALDPIDELNQRCEVVARESYDVGLKTMYRINVDSDKGVVTLKGRVDSEDTKRRAEAVAKRVSGVSAVKNELQVKGG